MWLASHYLSCDWTASGNQTWFTVKNGTDHDMHCVAEATFQILWDDASADIKQGNTGTMVLKRDPEDSDWYGVTCTGLDGQSADSSFMVWRD